MALSVKDLHDYQKRAINFQCSKPASKIILDMGLGKTIITLTSVKHLIDQNFLRGVLVVAPLRVANFGWSVQAKEWEHVKSLKFSKITGTKDQKIRGLLTKADVYLTNYENIKWLTETLNEHFIEKGKPMPFDGIVWDEITKMKNSGTHRVKSFMKVFDGFKWKTGLTGTPVSNGYKDLHGQYLVLDKGKRLGTSKYAFNSRFFRKVSMYKDIPNEGAEEAITELVSDITFVIKDNEYSKLPDVVINDILLKLPDELQAQYEKIEKEFIIEFDNGKTLDINNHSGARIKCLQYANGTVYLDKTEDKKRDYELVHDVKLSTLEEILESVGEESVLCMYQYKSDADIIMKRFKDYNPINLTEYSSESALNKAIDAFKTGKCRLMIGHPASIAFGIDGLQYGSRNIVWFGLTYSLELFLQANGRLRRTGQTAPVICHRLIMDNTMDIVQVEGLASKEKVQTSLTNAFIKYRAAKEAMMSKS